MALYMAKADAAAMKPMASRPVPALVQESCKLLPGADFMDAYQLCVSGQSLDAMAATRRVMDRVPGWIGSLMALRNALVKPLGLKTAAETRLDKARGVGMLPLISDSPQRVVLGLDDRHLDFRLCVDVENLEGDRQSVTASTVVRTHNRLGRIYLAIVKPFHRMIVPALLAQAARQ